MLNHAVVEIAGRQYDILPDKAFYVDYLGEEKSYECQKVLLIAEEGKLLVGNPYLKETLTIDILEKGKRQKIRVATYKAKANTRKVIGSKRLLSLIKLQQKESGSRIK